MNRRNDQASLCFEHSNRKASFEMQLGGTDRYLAAYLNDVSQNETKSQLEVHFII